MMLMSHHTNSDISSICDHYWIGILDCYHYRLTT